MSTPQRTGVDEIGLAGVLLIVGWASLLGVTLMISWWAIGVLGLAFIGLGLSAVEIRDRWVLRTICIALGLTSIFTAAMLVVSMHAIAVVPTS